LSRTTNANDVTHSARSAFGVALAYNGRDKSVAVVLSIVIVVIFTAIGVLGLSLVARFEWLQRRFAERQANGPSAGS
jgi:hypothetical protein